MAGTVLGAAESSIVRIVIRIAVVACMSVSPAFAQIPGTIEGRVALLDLPTIDANGVMAAYSDDAEDEAAFYAAEAMAAVEWYRGELSWDGVINMAVLDREDFQRTTAIPYPSPHAETATGFIVLADHVESHPGFDRWEIAGRDINAAWLFHELGHVIAGELGIASRNLWVNELIASVIMAGYVRSERPEFGGFQAGMPPRFADAGNYETLAEFDRLYFAMGQFDYLWFHFHIAEFADFIVDRAGSLAEAVEGLAREFPASASRRQETVPQTLVRLERIAPGIAERAAPLVR